MVALVLVADARDWNGWQILAAALGVGTFYVVTILVPWLVREQDTDATETRKVLVAEFLRADLSSEVREFKGGWVVPLGDGNGGTHESATHGPEVMSPEPPLALRT